MLDKDGMIVERNFPYLQRCLLLFLQFGYRYLITTEAHVRDLLENAEKPEMKLNHQSCRYQPFPEHISL
jgi:hypothetical protein